ncbi:MAG: hypothetical protein VX641_01285 [Planctomycetota bacterium]|nr:hypothetical protein [Planctomycetota bacterium]
MIYRLISKFNDDFGLLVFLIYLCLFVLAFLAVFLFPPLALILVVLGLVGFVGVWLLVTIMRSIEYSLARKALAGGNCPCCGGVVSDTGIPDPVGGRYLICRECSQVFEHHGRRAQEEDLLEEDEASASTL